MKTVKLFSLGLLLSLAWISCKNESATESTDAEVVVDSVFTSRQNDLVSNIAGISKAVANKITELETQLAAALDEKAKTDIGDELKKYQQFQEDLVEMGEKVAGATADNWSTVSEEAKTLHYDVKTAITNTLASPEKASQIAN